MNFTTRPPPLDYCTEMLLLRERALFEIDE